MKKIIIIGFLLLSFGLASCSSSHDREDFSDKYMSDDRLSSVPNYVQLREIPVPEKAILDMKKTLLFGSDPLVGRLAFSAPYDQSNLFDFYMQEMPKTGWQEITAVRSDSSFLTFMKGERVATIRLIADSETTASIFFDISMTRHKDK